MRRNDLGRNPCRRLPGRRSGFSILEALIVIFVLGIAAAISVPSLIGQLAKLRLESSATDVANLMRQTRLRAIRDNTEYTVEISGDEITGMGAYSGEAISLEFDQPVLIYRTGDGAANCLNKYDGTGSFDDNSVVYQGSGVATGTGAICIHDGKGNILQVVVPFATAEPKVRKYLPAGDSPTGNQGFFESTGFNPVTKAANIWIWY